MEARATYSAAGHAIRQLGFNPDYLTPGEQNELLAIHSELLRMEVEGARSGQPAPPRSIGIVASSDRNAGGR